ncbi:FAD-dependent oxidoreductase [Demequina oxidasica]|uniref:FAD-dependent oxidoreductase n=1 Tax=Demequina oxidasica TaxID=676199 RepID=UPI000A066647|nr:FAD-dependent oxidoreductase [Demequina oxidasica]
MRRSIRERADAVFPSLPIDGITDTKVVIIGAGQAGLSTAYHLVRLGLRPGVDVHVIDRGPSTGGAWQHRWSALRVGDAHRIHDLPGMSETGLSFESAPHDEPARDVVRRYYDAYERHFGLEVIRPATVVAVESPASSFTTADAAPRPGFLVTVRTEDGLLKYRSAVVVNASGTWHRPRIPAVAGRDVFEGRQVTTPEYSEASEFAGQRVAVVGAGTSALGFLDELSAAGAHTEWFTRREPVFADSGSDLGRDRALAAVQRQDEAAKAGRRLPSIAGSTGLPRTARVRRLEGRGALRRRPMFARLVSDGAVTTDGIHVPLDAVLWATGFDAELDHLDQLAMDTSRGGIPVYDGESVDKPGLFLAGYGPQASTIGANRAGRAMAKEIMTRLG